MASLPAISGTCVTRKMTKQGQVAVDRVIDDISRHISVVSILSDSGRVLSDHQFTDADMSSSV
jgi:hypothetical protein